MQELCGVLLGKGVVLVAEMRPSLGSHGQVAAVAGTCSACAGIPAKLRPQGHHGSRVGVQDEIGQARAWKEWDEQDSSNSLGAVWGAVCCGLDSAVPVPPTLGGSAEPGCLQKGWAGVRRCCKVPGLRQGRGDIAPSLADGHQLKRQQWAREGLQSCSTLPAGAAAVATTTEDGICFTFTFWDRF